MNVRPPFPIIYEDNHLLVINKPAQLATMGVAEGVESVLTQAKAYLKARFQKPGNVYLGIVSRLDAPVTGVVLLARTSKAASRLSEAFRKGDVQKTYLAITETIPDPPSGTCCDWLRKDERHRRMHLARPDQQGAQEARLHYRLCGTLPGDRGLVEVELLTGRKHQIRVQLAARGWPILGDRKYGARLAFPSGIALHAWQLALDHPVRREPVSWTAPLPRCWRAFLSRQFKHLADTSSA